MINEIIIAKNSGFCFGVKRAVDITVNYEKTKESSGTFTLGPLIHNDDVVNRLKEQNIHQRSSQDIDQLTSDDAIVIRSHGAAPDVWDVLERTGAKVIDATCPYVTAIHKKAKKYHELGYQIVIVGDKDHPEVIGINGWCGNTAVITRDGSDLTELPPKVCIVSQTTERLSNYDKAVGRASELCDELITFNTICSATKERQESADQVSKRVDIMIVIGGKNSSNSKKLYEICSKNCENTIFVENSTELPVSMFESRSIDKVGITAGASTPDWVINEVIDILKSIV